MTDNNGENMKLHLKKLVFITALFSATAFAYSNITYRCYSASGYILFGGNAHVSEIPTLLRFCEYEQGGTLVLGQKNNDPLN